MLTYICFIIITHINKTTTINYSHIDNKFITYKKLDYILSSFNRNTITNVKLYLFVCTARNTTRRNLLGVTGERSPGKIRKIMQFGAF